MPEASTATCPHCGARLARLALPDVAYDHDFDLACFSDECPYYLRGWAWMEAQFGVKTSYRYRVDAKSGFASPIPVWSPTALRSRILPDEAAAGAAPEEHP
jgi:hypothetical protein